MPNPTGKMTSEQIALLRTIKKTRERPSVQSDEWEVFCDLSDLGFVEDQGLGVARVTPQGIYALKTQRAALSEQTP